MLLETDDGGIYGLDHPQDPGSTDRWVSLNAFIEDTEFYQVAYDERLGVIVGGSQDNGTEAETYFSPYSTSLWTTIEGGDGGLTRVDPNGVRYFFSDSELLRDGQQVLMEDPVYGKVAYDGLRTADVVYVDQKVETASDVSYPFALNPSNPSQMLIGLTNVYESTDQGDHVTDITPTGMSGMVSYPYGLAYGGADNPDAAYVATNTGFEEPGPALRAQHVRRRQCLPPDGQPAGLEGRRLRRPDRR